MSNSDLLQAIDRFGEEIKTLRNSIRALKIDNFQTNPEQPSDQILPAIQIVNVTQAKQSNHQQNQRIVLTAKEMIDAKFDIMKKDLQNDPNNNVVVQQWVGDLMKISIQQAHKEHFMKDDQNSMRLKFASLILQEYSKYIIQGSKIKGIYISEFQSIFRNTSGNAIQYLQYKYETKKNKISDIKLTEQIKQTERLIDTRFDLLLRSETNLQFHSQGQLRRKIKEFLNKLIIECQQKCEMFKKDMKQVFNSNGNTDLHYEIGTKIRMKTKPYTEEELKQPGFFVKGNEMMRVMMKWIQQLLDFFQNDNRLKNNKGGFRVLGQNQMKKVANSERKQMWDTFARQNLNLQDNLEGLKQQIQSTISSIILASENDIKRIQSLDKSIINLLIVSDNIWKSLENYMMDTLITIFQSFYNIKRRYEYQLRTEADLQIFTFMLGDLLRCKCSGTRQQILNVFRALKQRQQNNEIRILRVKNRLNQSTNDFLINFAYQDPKKCFLLCEMQLALTKSSTSTNDDRAYHFKHFLYEMARSSHGMCVELAVMLYYLDNRKNYLKQHGLVFEPPKNIFLYDEESKSIVCKNCQNKNSVRGKSSEKTSYMCNNCCKLIQGYAYYFSGYQCQECQNNICPICYFHLCKFEKSAQFILNDFQSITKYFKPINKVYLKQDIKVLQRDISDLIQKHKFVAVFYFRKHSGVRQLQVIKKIPSTKYYSKIFSNQPFKVQEQLKKSIVLLLVPEHSPQIISRQDYVNDIQAMKNARKLTSQNKLTKQQLKKYFKYEVIQSYLHQKFDRNANRDLVLLKNSQNSKHFIVDYNMSQELDVQRYIADNKIKQVIQQINKNKSANQRLILFNVESPQLLQNIIEKQSIVQIEIQQSFSKLHSKSLNSKYQFLDLFPKVNNLMIYKTLSYSIHTQHSFDISLRQLIIRNCNLKSERIQKVSYPVLTKLDLSNNALTQIPSFQFPNIESISMSNNNITSIDSITKGFNKLNRIILKSNKIAQIPIFELPSLEVLNLNTNQIITFQNIPKFNTPNLLQLSITHNANQIQKTLDSLDNLPNLKQLYLSYNNLATIELENHPSLETLKLDHNILNNLTIDKMPNLKGINLSFNKMTLDSILPLVNQLELDVLQVYGNDIEYFPNVSSKIGTIKIEANKVFDQKSIQLSSRRSISNLGKKCAICHKIIIGIKMHYDDKNNATICQNKQCIEQWQWSNRKVQSNHSLNMSSDDSLSFALGLFQLVDIKKSTKSLI